VFVTCTEALTLPRRETLDELSCRFETSKVV
jgi:hypothetical protein